MSAKKHETYVPDAPKEPEVPKKQDEPPYVEPNEPEIFPEEYPIITVPERSDISPPELD